MTFKVLSEKERSLLTSKENAEYYHKLKRYMEGKTSVSYKCVSCGKVITVKGYSSTKSRLRNKSRNLCSRCGRRRSSDMYDYLGDLAKMKRESLGYYQYITKTLRYRLLRRST